MIPGHDDKNAWLAAIVEEKALEAVRQLGRLTAEVYLGALEAGLSPAETKDVTEAAVAAILRSQGAKPPEAE